MRQLVGWEQHQHSLDEQEQHQQEDNIMPPMGKGTYGSKVGRTKKKMTKKKCGGRKKK